MAVPKTWSFDYQALVKLTGMTINTAQQHRKRGLFDPDDLRSVLLWAARYATEDVRFAIVDAALRRESQDGAIKREMAKKASAKKRARKVAD